MNHVMLCLIQTYVPAGHGLTQRHASRPDVGSVKSAHSLQLVCPTNDWYSLSLSHMSQEPFPVEAWDLPLVQFWHSLRPTPFTPVAAANMPAAHALHVSNVLPSTEYSPMGQGAQPLVVLERLVPAGHSAQTSFSHSNL